MRKLLFILLLLIASFDVLSANAIQGINQEKPLFAPDRIVIQLTEEAYKLVNIPEELYAEADAFDIFELDSIMAELGVTKVIRAHRKVKDTVWEKQTGFDRWFILIVLKDIDILKSVEILNSSRLVEKANPEYIAYTTAVPNDTYYANNWGHNNTAQLPSYQGTGHTGPLVGTVGFDADMQLAWDQSQGYGSASIVIAIIDTGVDLTHPDLLLTTGYDYGDNDSNPMDDSADPGHGTACSGVAAGIANNGIGVAGVAGNCTVMPLKVADSAGNMYFTAIDNAVTHAADYNADVISMSLGAEGGMGEGDSPSTDAALTYAYNAGVVIFAATANSNASTIAYPSNHTAVISVGASSPTGERKSTTSSDGEYWWGSNYGVNVMDDKEAVDIMAPTILPATDLVSGGYSSTNYYMWFNGTSCATPYAAGIAALLLSKDPSLTPAQVRTAMTTTATDMSIDGGAGWDRYTGYGLFNANTALNSLIPGMPACIITAPLNGSVYNLNSTITVNVNATDTDGTITSVAFYIDDVYKSTDTISPYSWNWNTTGYSGGSHTIKAIATDNSSNTAQSTVSITLLAPANEGFETGNFSSYPWEQSGNLPWIVQSTEKYSGTYAAKSGAIGDNQLSTMAVTVNITAAGNISFFQKISSEANYDSLQFFIDNNWKGAWSGAGSWIQQSYAVTAGIHEFKWTYDKDLNTVSGSDCAWIDHIIFPPHNIPVPPTISWNPASFTQNLAPDQTDSQILNIGNTGTLDLDYTATLPTGITTVLDETFSTTSIPAGWTQAFVSGTNLSWIFTAGGHLSHPAAAYDGAYNALLYKSSSTASVTNLVTPSLDLSGATSASLTFWHTQELWPSDQDELRVYYKTTSGGSWNILATYTASIAAWTMESIDLPNLTGTYYIAFEGTAQYGYGVCLDKVVVTKSSGSTTPWLSLNGTTSVTNTISGVGSNNITVGFNTAGMSAGTYNSTITVTSNSISNPTVLIPVTLNIADLTPPVAPTDITIVLVTLPGSTLISWTASIGDHDGYYIYIASLPDFSDEILLATLPSTQTSFTDTLAYTREMAFYRVTAYRD